MVEKDLNKDESTTAPTVDQVEKSGSATPSHVAPAPAAKPKCGVEGWKKSPLYAGNMFATDAANASHRVRDPETGYAVYAGKMFVTEAASASYWVIDPNAGDAERVYVSEKVGQCVSFDFLRL